MGEVAKIRNCGIETAELRPLGQGITAGCGIVVVVVEVGTVVVVVEVGVVVVEVGTVVVVVVVARVVVVVVAAGLAEKAPAGSITRNDPMSTLERESATTPRRRFHKALTASLYWRVATVTGQGVADQPEGSLRSV